MTEHALTWGIKTDEFGKHPLVCSCGRKVNSGYAFHEHLFNPGPKFPEWTDVTQQADGFRVEMERIRRTMDRWNQQAPAHRARMAVQRQAFATVYFDLATTNSTTEWRWRS